MIRGHGNQFRKNASLSDSKKQMVLIRLTRQCRCRERHIIPDKAQSPRYMCLPLPSILSPRNQQLVIQYVQFHPYLAKKEDFSASILSSKYRRHGQYGQHRRHCNRGETGRAGKPGTRGNSGGAASWLPQVAKAPVLPYANEAFGVYQPLIGWRSQLQHERIATAIPNRVMAAARALRP